jgi:hypothetical protein
MAAMMTELAAELAAITDYSTAANLINGQLGGGQRGIRARYLARAEAFVAAGHTGPALCQNVSNLCDRAVAAKAPQQCEATGWTSIPTSSLKEK